MKQQITINSKSALNYKGIEQTYNLTLLGIIGDNYTFSGTSENIEKYKRLMVI